MAFSCRGRGGCDEAAGDQADGLPEDEKELFHLVWYLGPKQEEAARMLDCSVRTIKRRWESAKRLLAESLGDERPT